MSRPPASGPPSNYVDDASRRFQPPAPHRPSTHSHPGMHPYQRDSPGVMSVSLPPLRQMSSTPPTPSERRLGNPLGVHSILNPQADIVNQQRNWRRSASQRESVSPIDSQPSHNLPSISRPPSVDSTQAESVSTRPFQPPHRPPPKHRSSPRSPALHRAHSLGVLGAPTGTIDAHQSPFLTATTRSHGPDMVTSQPALPTPPVGPRAAYFPTAPASAPTPPPGMSRSDHRRPSVSFPQSGSASPLTSYSPYSRPASISSSHLESSSHQGSYMAGQNNSHQDAHNPPIAMETERSMIPMAPSGQSSIQFMTIKSQQGHHVQIPVDVQAASKVADEKRRRNAGASARFRARRKEKEREASMSISRLEQQIRHANEDVEYYRGERDYFKAIVLQQPGADRHYARPSSPRLRRTSMPASAAASTAGDGSAGSPYSDYDDDEPMEPERNVRRRTSNYHPVTGPSPTHLHGNAPPQQAYSAPSFPPVNNPPMNPPQPPQPFDTPEQGQGSQLGTPRHSAQRPLHHPFAPEPGRFDERNWASGPGRDNRE